MRTALPNANFVAFTGTPLLGSKRLTNKWFGNYVSEYNFAQAVENGSTVPLYYSRRVPEVGLTNNFLDDDVVDIIEEENLTDAETKVLENSTSRILEVIKRDDRLDKIAKDIAHHFPRRGFLGKALVVSVDKYTAVKMYDKVQHYWEEEKNHYVDFSEGFYVTKENAIDFLEEKLSIIGLNSKERNEFIMYWLPILEKNDKSLVYFELTKERDSYNKLIINPNPDSILRVAIHIKKVNKKTSIKEEVLTTFNRNGFTAVEWGGVIY